MADHPPELDEIRKELEELRARNARVEQEKAWETSWARRLVITAMTWLGAWLWLFSLGTEHAARQALVPQLRIRHIYPLAPAAPPDLDAHSLRLQVGTWTIIAVSAQAGHHAGRRKGLFPFVATNAPVFDDVDRMREVAGQREPEPGQVTDAYFLLDASASYRVFDRVKVYVHGRNLLNETYLVSRRPYGARPGAPRWVQAGIKVDFSRSSPSEPGTRSPRRRGQGGRDRAKSPSWETQSATMRGPNRSADESVEEAESERSHHAEADARREPMRTWATLGSLLGPRPRSFGRS
jgi:hypothetical protein